MATDAGSSPATPTAKIMTELFPVDTGTWMSRILGIQKRSADRMLDGYSTTAPRILEKAAKQLALKEKLQAQIWAAIEEAEAAGIHILVTRYTLADLLKGDELMRDEDPI